MAITISFSKTVDLFRIFVYLPRWIGLFFKRKKIYLEAEIKKLRYSFYNRSDVLEIARNLLGKILVTQIDNKYTSGRIVETEAYAGVGDRASHAYGGRRTNRTEIMYARAGHAYIYLCYGIHHLFNVVTGAEDTPHAILIRALEPMDGIEWMLKRTGKKKPDSSLTRGPGNVSKAMGLLTRHSGLSLLNGPVFIGEDSLTMKEKVIISTPRIGVAYAMEDAKLPYRFYIVGNPYVSKGTVEST
jgi:DNA-3-methyladenine glycosylase